MLRVSVLSFALLLVQSTVADDPIPTESSPPADITKLINRIDQLENRIKELERQAAQPPSVTVVPQYHSYNPPQGQPYIPNTIPPSPYYRPAPGSPGPYTPQTNPAELYQPQFPQNKTVPESWKPFNFNGMQYFIIPVNEAERLNRPQGNDRATR